MAAASAAACCYCGPLILQPADATACCCCCRVLTAACGASAAGAAARRGAAHRHRRAGWSGWLWRSCRPLSAAQVAARAAGGADQGACSAAPRLRNALAARAAGVRPVYAAPSRPPDMPLAPASTTPCPIERQGRRGRRLIAQSVTADGGAQGSGERLDENAVCAPRRSGWGGEACAVRQAGGRRAPLKAAKRAAHLQRTPASPQGGRGPGEAVGQAQQAVGRQGCSSGLHMGRGKQRRGRQIWCSGSGSKPAARTHQPLLAAPAQATRA